MIVLLNSKTELMIWRLSLVVSYLLIGSYAGGQDTLHLANGRTVIGDITWQDKRKVFIIENGDRTRYKAQEIKRIARKRKHKEVSYLDYQFQQDESGVFFSETSRGSINNALQWMRDSLQCELSTIPGTTTCSYRFKRVYNYETVFDLQLHGVDSSLDLTLSGLRYDFQESTAYDRKAGKYKSSIKFADYYRHPDNVYSNYSLRKHAADVKQITLTWIFRRLDEFKQLK